MNPALLLEAERRGILPPDKQGLLDEARKRGLIKPPMSTAEMAGDAAMSGMRGINKGVADLVTAPYRALDWALETASGGNIGLPDVDKMPAWQTYREPQQPQSDAGRYAMAAGQAVGGAAIPAAGMVGIAPRLAAMAPTTTGRAIGQTIGQQIAARPGTALALDAASAATGGAATQGAADLGYGPGGQAIAGLAGALAPGFAASYFSPNRAPIGTQTGRNMSQQRLDDAARDAASFERQDVRSFGPAYNQGPIASVGKQLTETPIVGAPLRNNLDETYQDAASAVARLADDVAPNATYETAGLNVQRGLDRFRDTGFTGLQPQTVQQMGINPMAPVQRQQTGGAAQMQRIQDGRPLVEQITGGAVQGTRGQPVPLPVPYSQRYANRTTIEDLSETELSRVIRTPADQTSFSTRMEALYERANRNINVPIMQANGNRNANLVPTANSGAVVRQIVGDEARTGIRTGLQGRYGQMFETLANPRANATLATLRSMRTAIGRDLSNFGMYDASLDRTQLRRLYASLSGDIEMAMQDIAVRAATQTRAPGNQRLSQADARRAAQALRDHQVADRYARAGFDRVDRFLSIVRSENPQAAARMLVRGATDGAGGNMRMFRSAMAVLRPEERAEFASLVIRELGAPQPSARGIVQETGFSPSSFVTRYQQMSPEARRAIFPPAHQRALDDLFNIANRLANVEAMANTSRSATNAMNLSGGAAAIGALASGSVATPLLIAGSGVAASALMSRPAYTRWMISYMQLRAAVRSGQDRALAPLIRHASGLDDFARLNPAIMPALLAVQQEVEELRNGRGASRTSGRLTNSNGETAAPRPAQ